MAGAELLGQLVQAGRPHQGLALSPLDSRESCTDFDVCRPFSLLNPQESLDDITKTVVEKFTPAPNRHLPPPEFPGSPYTKDELQRTLFVKSVRDVRTLELSFTFPDESAYYATKPGSFLSHLIGHEGEGSILSYLKKQGWANGMSAGAGNGASGFEFFKISVDLTKEGLGALRC